MRTTLSIDDDIMEAARSLASHQSRTVGEVVSDLARKGLMERSNLAKSVQGIPVFKVSKRATPLTLERVKSDEDEW